MTTTPTFIVLRKRFIIQITVIKICTILLVCISPCCIEKALILFYLSCLTNAFYTAGGTNAPPLLSNSYSRSHKSTKFGMRIVHQIF